MMVHARRLTYRSLRFSDRKLKEATLFPVFDREAVVQRILMVWPAGRRLILLDPEVSPVRVPSLGAIRIESSFEGLSDVSSADLPEAHHWWHWDPWWMLRSELWIGHGAVPALRETNACHYFDSCHFDPTLSGVVRIRDGSGKAGPFRSELLPEPKWLSVPTKQEPGFCLDPIWKHAGWPQAAITGG